MTFSPFTKRFIKIGVVLIVVCLVTTGALRIVGYHLRGERLKQIREEQLRLQKLRPRPKPPTNTNSNSNTSTTPIPSTLLLNVPFTAQAPTANWDELHNEACEEASSIMVNAYFSGITSLPASDVEAEISRLTQWQKDNQNGRYLDQNTEEVARMLREVYSLKTEIAPVTEQGIKEALAANKLVVIPADGRLLGNPNFRAPGPPYHMFVIKGYNSSEFITNDPGTRKGLSYPYSFDTIYDASGTWDNAAHMTDTTQKAMLIVSK